MKAIKKKIDDLIEKISDIPGLKMITLTVEDSDFICEINGKKFKNDVEFSLFIAKLVRRVSFGGRMTVVYFYNNKKIISGSLLGRMRGSVFRRTK